MESLRVINEQIKQGEDADQHIRKALIIAGEEMNKTQLLASARDQNLRTDIALATYLSIRLAEVKMTIESSTNENRYFTITDEFLKVMNSSLLCGKECPTKLSTLINCHLLKQEHSLKFGVLARKPSENLIILKADSFTLNNTSGIKNCYETYVGPEFLLFDPESNCLTPIPEFQKTKFILFTKKNIECTKSVFTDYVFQSKSCSVEHHFESIQMKNGRKHNFVYCYEQNITIKKQTFECPNYPFKLSVKTPFKVNDFEYQINDTIVSTNNNYIWSEIANLFLTHVKTSENSSLDEYLKEVNLIRTPQLKVIEIQTKLGVWIICGILGMFITLAVIYWIVRCYYLKQRDRRFADLRQSIAVETARQLVNIINLETSVGQAIGPIDDLEQPD
jgi:hypothetical protein